MNKPAVNFYLIVPKIYVKWNQGIRVFEVKRTDKVTSSMLRGIKAFLKDYPFAKAYFIYGGERHLREGDIEILPVKYVLKELPAILS